MQELERQFKANGGTFKEYRIGELFVIKNNPQLDKDYFVFSENAKYPYFTRTENNNGLLGYVDFLDKEHLIKGNSLAVGMISMRFHYMAHSFYAGQFTKTAFPKFDCFNEAIALYFISLLSKFQKTYQGVLVRDFEQKFYDSIISLPTLNGKIAFDYMESVIRELQNESIIKLNDHLKSSGLENTELTQEEKDAVLKLRNGHVVWKEFRIGELFEKQSLKFKKKKFNKAQDISKVRTSEYSIPLVNAKNGNNGIMYYGREMDFETAEMCIDIVNDGAVSTGNVYPQPQKTGVLYNAYLVKPIFKANEELLIYFAQTLQKAIKLKFGYDKKASWERVQEEYICLPITTDEKIDWDFMQNLITAESRLAIEGVVKWKTKLQQIYEIN